MSEPLLIAGMAVVTLAARYPLLALVGRVTLPAPVSRALRFVPTAVLVAITVPVMVMPRGIPELTHTNAYLVGGLASIAIAWRTKNLLLTIVVGMAVFLAWRALFGV